MSENDRVHVLVVEDTMVQALMLEHVLTSHQFEVSVTRSGGDALDFLQNKLPDLILSDVSMPEMDGYELCRRVKSNPNTKDIPFILLSAFSDAQDIVKIIACRADNFLLKRFDAEYLVGRLTDVLATNRLRASASSASKGEIVFGGKTHTMQGHTAQLDMILSAFTTVVHLVPLVKDE